jgi:putative phosphonate catabolism associated alcohol dehydrogenase
MAAGRDAAGRELVSGARAAVFDGAGQPMRITDFPLPTELAAGETIVRITLATICASDLHTVQGRRVEPTPCVLGHEGVGIVVMAGAGREGFLGHRVSWSSADSCGRCAACAEYDLPQKCSAVLKYGHVAIDGDRALLGTYASHIVLRAGTHLVSIPPGLPDWEAATANCALATMVHAIEHRPRSCQTAVIHGAGLLGLFGCALLHEEGLARVVVVEPDPGRRTLVASFGGEAVADSALSVVDKSTVDVFLEASGQSHCVAEAMQLLRPGGVCTLVGSVHPGPPLDLSAEALVRGCVTLRGVHNYAPHHLDRAIAFLATRFADLPLQSVISKPLPLDQMDAAMQLAASRRWLRVAIAPGLPAAEAT